MTWLTRSLIALLFAGSALLVGALPVAAASTAPGPGAAAGFAVLADGTGLTCTGSTVAGPVGVSSSTTAVTLTAPYCDFPVPVAAGAYAAFRTDYAWIAGHLTPCHVLTGTLAGVTLGPGTYCFDAAATLTGTLTLTGTGPWLFEIGARAVGALTANSFTVVSTNPCNAVWWVQADVTMTTSHFVGTILGGGAITLTDTTLNGRAWATGAMTMTGSTISGCLGSGTPVPVQCNPGKGKGHEDCDRGHSKKCDQDRSNDDHGDKGGSPGRWGAHRD
jgi:hypothetical protein